MRISRPGVLVFFGLCLSWAIGSPRPASSQLLGPEFQVNTHTSGNQTLPAVAADASGTFVVAWQSHEYGQPEGAEVRGQRFDSSGAPAGPEFPINSWTTDNQYGPRVAMDAASRFVVVWSSYGWDGTGQDGSYAGVFAQRFDPAGNPLGGEFRVNSFTPLWQHGPAVAAADNGAFLVVWESYGQDGSSSGVFGQRFDSSGLPAGAEFQVNSYTYSGQVSPAVAVDAGGNFVVVWAAAGAGDHDGVFVRRFDAAGVPLGAELRVNGLRGSPAVAANGSGGFVVVGSSSDQDGSGVFGQRFDTSGLPVDGEFQVNEYMTGNQFSPAVAAERSGGFVVSWTSDGQDGSSFGVFGRRLGSAGLPLAGEFQINTFTAYGQRDSVVSAVGGGDFVDAWASESQDGHGTGVFGRRSTLRPFADGFESGDACAWSASVGGGCP